MKKNLCLLLVCLLSAAAPLQAQDMQQAHKLIDQAQKYLYNNPKQASYYAAQASALFPEDEPSEVRAQAMILLSSRTIVGELRPKYQESL